jgi:hypothetical protein
MLLSPEVPAPALDVGIPWTCSNDVATAPNPTELYQLEHQLGFFEILR